MLLLNHASLYSNSKYVIFTSQVCSYNKLAGFGGQEVGLTHMSEPITI